MGYREAFGVGVDIEPLPENLYFPGVRPGENYAVADVTNLEAAAPEVIARPRGENDDDKEQRVLQPELKLGGT